MIKNVPGKNEGECARDAVGGQFCFDGKQCERETRD